MTPASLLVAKPISTAKDSCDARPTPPRNPQDQRRSCARRKEGLHPRHGAGQRGGLRQCVSLARLMPRLRRPPISGPRNWAPSTPPATSATPPESLLVTSCASSSAPPP